MKIIGMDLHTRQQTIVMLDDQSGERDGESAHRGSTQAGHPAVEHVARRNRLLGILSRSPAAAGSGAVRAGMLAGDSGRN